jgi:hypothetical protein
MNRQMFRVTHRWYDARNTEIENLPKYKSIENLTATHWNKLVNTILQTNPSVLQDYIQHKLAILYLKEYFTNPSLLKEKRKIVGRGRTRKNIIRLMHGGKSSIFDYTLCY